MRQHIFLVAVVYDEAYVGLVMGGVGLSTLAMLSVMVGVYRLWINYHPPGRIPACSLPQE